MKNTEECTSGFSPVHDTVGDTAKCERRDIAERIAAGFEEVYDWAKKDIRWDVPICHKVETVELPRRMISDAEYADALAEGEKLDKLTWRTEGTPEEKLFDNSVLQASRNRVLGIVSRYKVLCSFLICICCEWC